MIDFSWSSSLFVYPLYPPGSPRPPLPPYLGFCGSARGSPASWFLHTVLAKINIFHFGADSEKTMIFHFLLRSHVILLLLRYLIFQNPLFRRLFRFGPPLGPKKNSIDNFWRPLGSTLAPDCAPGTSPGAALAAEHAPGAPSGPSRNRSDRKMKLLIFRWFYHHFLSHDVLWPIQDPPKRAPMDLIDFPEGPLESCRGAPQKTLRLL